MVAGCHWWQKQLEPIGWKHRMITDKHW